MIYKKTQTTSTKCQYQVAAIKPKWCVVVKCPNQCLYKQIINKKAPIFTWNPWKPVAMINVDPNILSDILKGKVQYSSACKKLKTEPINIEINIAKLVSENLYIFVILLWAQVTVKPEVSNKNVFNNGKVPEVIISKPTGGQMLPIWIAGDILE